MVESSFNRNQIVNIPSSGRQYDETNNRDNSQDHIDKMTSYFQSIRAKNNKIEKDEFLGYVLFSHLIKIEKFEQIYDQSSEFFKELMYAQEIVEPRKDASIIQYRVHIPELTGMLPFPDFSNYAKYLKMTNELLLIDFNTAEDEKRYERLLKESEELKKEFWPEVLKLDLFPRFYQYTEKGSAHGPLPGLFCKVKMTNSLPTKGTGILLKVYDEAVSDLGIEGGS